MLLPCVRSLRVRVPGRGGIYRYASCVPSVGAIKTFVRKLTGLAVALAFIMVIKLLLKRRLASSNGSITNASTAGIQTNTMVRTRRVVLEPGEPYPLDSDHYNMRVQHFKAMRPTSPKGVRESQFGNAYAGLHSNDPPHPAHASNATSSAQQSVAVTVLLSNETLLEPLLEALLRSGASNNAQHISSVSLLTAFLPSEAAVRTVAAAAAAANTVARPGQPRVQLCAAYESCCCCGRGGGAAAAAAAAAGDERYALLLGPRWAPNAQLLQALLPYVSCAPGADAGDSRLPPRIAVGEGGYVYDARSGWVGDSLEGEAGGARGVDALGGSLLTCAAWVRETCRALRQRAQRSAAEAHNSSRDGAAAMNSAAAAAAAEATAAAAMAPQDVAALAQVPLATAALWSLQRVRSYAVAVPGGTTKQRVLLVTRGLEDAQAAAPLAVAFAASKEYELVAVLAKGAGGEGLAEGGAGGALCGVVEIAEEEGADSDSCQDWVERWQELLQLHAPTAVIAVQSAQNALPNTALQLAVDALSAAGGPLMALIVMPPGNFSSAQWLAALPPLALASWGLPDFTLSVVVDGHSDQQLAALLRSLLRVRTYGAPLPLELHVESAADDATLAGVAAFARAWEGRGGAQVCMYTCMCALSIRVGCVRTYGTPLPLELHVESADDDATLAGVAAFARAWEGRGVAKIKFRLLVGGKMRAVTEAYYPSNSRHHHGIIVPSDAELSPLMMAWARLTVLTYQYGRAEDFAHDLYGLSLSAQARDCTGARAQANTQSSAQQQAATDTDEAGDLPEPQLSLNDTLYLHQVPCGVGAVLLPEAWMEYRAYLAARLLEDHIVAVIPRSPTALWRTTWQRYMAEMAYQSRYYMLYPNLPMKASFARTPTPPRAGPDGETGNISSVQEGGALAQNVSAMAELFLRGAPGGGMRLPQSLPRFDARGDRVAVNAAADAGA
ncbi:hypothetical protein JKP88DRAFT_335139 [Tribonema minus]|uniref:Uncharacterized protein n=1 Tax=Tribonema minus TaxID=303371 RepID=A0A835YMQ8_9STRA|nr:hypothetical protein JKP88DRAFT_335139 [Tribonema minus]